MRSLIALLLSILCTVPAFAQNVNQPPGLGWNQGGQAATNDMPYVTVTNQPNLSHERALGIDTTFPNGTWIDTGANGQIKLGWTGALDVTRGGTGSGTAAGALINLLGAPDKGKLLVGNGTGWVTLSPGTNNYYLQANSATATGLEWASSLTGPVNTQYLVLSLDGNLTNERRFVVGSGLTGTDSGADDDFTVELDNTVAATLTDTQTLTNKTLTAPIIATSAQLSAGGNVINLSFAPSTTRTYAIPDVADSSFVMTAGNQTVSGSKTFSDLILSSNTFKIAGPYTITVPTGASDELLTVTSTANVTNKTLTDAILESSLIFKSVNQYAISWSNPAANRTYSITDAGSNADFAMKSGTPTNKGIAYGDGNKIIFGPSGTDGKVLKLVSGVPSWESVGGFGNYFGDGSDGDVTISTNTQLGSGDDDANFIIKQYNSLTINSSCTLEPAGRTRALIIYVKGNCTINGTIRNSKGASASATAINLWKNPPVSASNISTEINNQSLTVSSVNYSTPAVGGAGGAGQSAAGAGTTGGNGVAGSAGSSGGTGGGGGGAGGNGSGTAGNGGNGSAGTAYSGGAGGGGGGYNAATTVGTNATAGGTNGGAGGNSGTNTPSGGNTAVSGGGAGNPGGSSSAPLTTSAGPNADGTGGIIYLIVGGDLTIGGTGVITAPGTASPALVTIGGSSGFTGGGSGGGAVVVLYAGTLSNSGTLSAPGGASGTITNAGFPRFGGAGGAGSVTGPTKIGGI